MPTENVPPIKPDLESEISIDIDPSRIVNSHVIRFKASGVAANESTLRRVVVNKLDFTANTDLAPVFDWELIRTIETTKAIPKEGEISKKRWGRSKHTSKAQKRVVSRKLLRFSSEDLKSKEFEPIKQDETLQVVIFIRTQLIEDILRRTKDPDGIVRTNLRMHIDGWQVPVSVPIRIKNCLAGTDSSALGINSIALDYGNQDFMLSCCLYSTQPASGAQLELRTPSMISEEGRGAFNRMLRPETSRIVIHDKYDEENVIFTSGYDVFRINRLNSPDSEDESQKKPENNKDNCVWQDSDFNGSRIESLKPFLTSDIEQSAEKLKISGRSPAILLGSESDSEKNKKVFLELLQRYFTRIFQSVCWKLSDDKNLTWPGKAPSTLIFTHPVGINRSFRTNIIDAIKESGFVDSDNPSNIKFINEAMAALGAVWVNHITHHENTSGATYDFRNSVRIANNLNPDSSDDDEVLILLVDIGHGTTDISLCSASVEEGYELDDEAYERKIIQLEQIFSFSKLVGGRNLTRSIFQNFVNKLVEFGIPQSIINAAISSDNPGYFWRFMDAVEQLKIDFSATTSEDTPVADRWSIPRPILNLLEEVATQHGQYFEPEHYEDKVITRQEIETWIEPVVKEVASMVASISNYFNSPVDGHSRTIDFYSFVGQSMNMPFLKHSIYRRMFPFTDLDLIVKDPSIITLPSDELKGIVAKGAICLLGGMYPNIKPTNYQMVEEVFYSVYIGDPRNNGIKVIDANTPIENEFVVDELDLKISDEFYCDLNDLFSLNNLPNSLEVYICYEEIVFDGKPLTKYFGNLFFDKELLAMDKTKINMEGVELIFRITSDEYVVAEYHTSKDKQRHRLNFAKSDSDLKESIDYYHSSEQ